MEHFYPKNVLLSWLLESACNVQRTRGHVWLGCPGEPVEEGFSQLDETSKDSESSPLDGTHFAFPQLFDTSGDGTRRCPEAAWSISEPYLQY